MKTHSHKQRGFLTGNLSTNLFWISLLLLTIASAVFFSYSVFSKFKSNKGNSATTAQKQEIVSAISNNYRSTTKFIDTIIDEYFSQEATTLQQYDNNLSSFDKYGTVKRRIISSLPLNSIKPKPYPEINFATLDQLKQTKETAQNIKPEIHLFGNSDQYFNLVRIIDLDKDWFLILSVDTKKLFENLPQINIEGTRVTWEQKIPNSKNLVLKSWGNINSSHEKIITKQNINDSQFLVSFEDTVQKTFFNSIGLVPSIAGVTISLLLLTLLCRNLVILQKQTNKKQKELRKYIPVPELRIHDDQDENKNEIHDGDASQITPKAEHQTLKKETLRKKETMLDKNIFRAYDIRGIVDESLTVDAVTQIGRAIGTENLNRGKDQIVVARDGRLSGPKLLDALIEGLIQSGNKVINIGAVPTGVLYFATHHLETGSGVMLTGSHNPSNYNGLKIMLNGETLSGDLITNLYEMIISEQLKSGEGSVQEMDIVDDYIDQIASDIKLNKEMKVVVDAGNGIGGEVGVQVLEEIGCEVIPLYCEIDGNFPNHHPDPSVPKNLEDLISTVKAVDADLGIAYDGDADRLGVVTKQGEMIYSDRILMLFAKDILSRQPGASIIFDVKCTGHLPKIILKHGGQPIIWKTGHSFMKAKLKETGAAMAGEMSGHFFFKERWFGFDDGIYSAARLLEILDQENRPINEIFDELPNSVSTPELNCKTDEGANYAFMDKFVKSANFPDAHLTTIDGIRADFVDGWGLVRCSNTTPCLVMRFDAENEEALERIKQEFKSEILKVDDSLDLPF